MTKIMEKDLKFITLMADKAYNKIKNKIKNKKIPVRNSKKNIIFGQSTLKAAFFAGFL